MEDEKMNTENNVSSPEEKSAMKMEAHHPLLIPGAIVIAGAFIALALFFSSGEPRPQDTGDKFNNNGSSAVEDIRPVSEDDHVFGNPDAPVTIIEYSDFECPFCERFHPTVQRIVEDFDGEVNWVYRHFPLSSIHPQAGPAALASECVANIAGNDAFWEFGDALFKNQAVLGMNLYTSLASEYGVSEEELTICMQSDEVNQAVTDDFNEVVAAGGRGTPYSVIISRNGELFPFSGALPYEQVKPLIEKALQN